MRVSVVLCTYNRAAHLPNVLDGLARSVMPATADWEVLVVDNNSSDETASVANDFAEKYPAQFRYVFEKRPGKSHALNTGVREARGDVIAFLDDDVTLEPTWLRNLTLPLESGDWAGVGGRTILAEQFSPPAWLALEGPHRMGFALAALFDEGNEAHELREPPFGANMAYRKKCFERCGLFRTDMGPSPDRDVPRPNEDTEFGRRVIAAGGRICYEPSAVVYHPVPSDRIRKEYFLRWWFDAGRAQIREIGRRPDILGIQRRYWAITKIVLAVVSVRALRWIVSFDPAKRFFRKCMVWLTAGQIAEIYRQWGAAREADSTAGAIERLDSATETLATR